MNKEWFTSSELAALRLPDVPCTDRGLRMQADRESWRSQGTEWSGSNPRGVWRRRQGNGGGFEYHYALLPARARAEIVRRFSAQPDPTPDGGRSKAKEKLERSDAWMRFERLADGAKGKAKHRLEVIAEIDALVMGGTGKELAIRLVCDRRAIPTRTYYDWEGRIHGVERADWLPYLADHYVGRTNTAEMSQDAWDYFLADYLTQSRPALAASYIRTKEAGEANGWVIPSEKTFKRRLQREVPAEVVVLKREGEEAVKRMYPAQRRDRSTLHALEAVNWDGHMFDVFCRWPGVAKPDRPVISVFQDLYSGKILSWRIDRSENTAAFRLAFGDMAERYGYPDHITIDNTLTAANKEMTGGTPTRFRFKVKADEQHGLFTILGIKVHWTQPYHGQSKPIERAFLDLCEYIAKAPDCVGAYTGNKPTAKPENYGSRAIPIADFIAHVEREIRRHNARPGRQSRVCGGVMSFDEAFEKSYVDAPIRKASPDHRFLWLLSSKVVTARKPDGHVELHDNRYWCPELARLIGTKLVLRYDPDNLHQPVRVYRLDGSFVAIAAVKADTGFYSESGKAEVSKERGNYLRGTKMSAEALVRLSAAQAAAMRPPPPEEVLPEAKVVRPMFSGNLALKPVPEDEEAEPRGRTFNFDDFAKGVEMLRQQD